MAKIRPRAVYSVAKKEFADKVRNKWILLLIILFVILTIAASYLAAGQRVSSRTVSSQEFKESYQLIIAASIMQNKRIDFPGLDPDDLIIIKDQVVYIASQHNSSLNMTVTYVWFNSSHMGEDEGLWYNSSLDHYMNYDVITEGDQTGNYSIGDPMTITLHIIEVDSDLIKGEFIKELWDSENKIPKTYLPAGSLSEGGVESAALGSFEETVGVTISITSLLIPIIAIMLGYSTISGEGESGALIVVLSYPIKRFEVLLGKYIGLGMVIVTSAVIGFGAAGIVVAATSGFSQWGNYLIFIGLTVLLGLLFLSLTICASSKLKRRVTSLAAGLFIFFWGMIYGMIIFGVYLGTGGSMEDLMMGGANFPDWFWTSIVLSPIDMNQMSIMLAFNIKQVFGFNVDAPEFMTLGFLVFVQLLWTIIPLILAYYFFEKRDI